MAYRHRVHKALGGEVYAGKGSNVEKEARETGAKRGGRHHKGGGAVKRKAGGKVPGFKSGGRADRMNRGGSPFSSASKGIKNAFAKGGAVGSNKHPFSTAAEGVDHGRTTHNVGRDPGGKGAGGHGKRFHSPGEATQAGSHKHFPDGHHEHGGHHHHQLHSHHGKKDHPGHHFASGGKVDGFKHGGSAHGKDHTHHGRMKFVGGHHSHHAHHKKDGGRAGFKAGGATTMKQVFASGGLVRGKGGRFAKGGAATQEDG
jgi:hypothetical protein